MGVDGPQNMSQGQSQPLSIRACTYRDFYKLVVWVQATTIGMAEAVYQPGVRVPEVSSTSVAAKAGLKSGDIILRVGEHDVPASSTAVSNVVHAIVYATLSFCSAGKWTKWCPIPGYGPKKRQEIAHYPSFSTPVSS